MSYVYFEVSIDNENLVKELREEGDNITELMNNLLKAYTILRTKKEPII